MFKNVASQKLAVYAWDSAAGAPKTGDAANITAQISKDGGTTAATNDVAPTELDATDAKGIYIFDMTQAETNADLVILSAVSGTSDIDLSPVVIYTVTDLAGNTLAEPAQGAPGATISTADKIGFLYKAWRNRSNQTSTTYQLFNDDATTVDHKATVSDDATTAEKGEVATGP